MGFILTGADSFCYLIGVYTFYHKPRAALVVLMAYYANSKLAVLSSTVVPACLANMHALQIQGPGLLGWCSTTKVAHRGYAQMQANFLPLTEWILSFFLT